MAIHLKHTPSFGAIGRADGCPPPVPVPVPVPAGHRRFPPPPAPKDVLSRRRVLMQLALDLIEPFLSGARAGQARPQTPSKSLTKIRPRRTCVPASRPMVRCHPGGRFSAAQSFTAALYSGLVWVW